MFANNSSKTLRALSIVMVAAMLLGTVACGTPAPTAAPTQPPAPTAVPTPTGPRGTLTVASAEQPEFLDPVMSLQILNWTVSFTMFDTLVKVDEAGKVSPSLALSWETVSPTAWKFNLRKDVKFHDGTPFTSASVKATLDHIVDPAANARQIAVWNLYDRTETPDDYTAIVYTKQPMGTMLSSLSLTCMIPPNPAKPLTELPIGTGPFKFVEWVKDDHLTVTANTEYWGGAPKLEKIVFRTIPELATRVSALEKGEVDLVDVIPSEEFPRLQAAGIQLLKQPTTYLRFIWLGNEGALANVKVRQAINLAIDRKSIIEDLFQGEGYEVKGCIAPGVVGYCEKGELKYDIAAAKALMKEAGYEQGFEMEMKTAEYLSKQKEMAEVIASYLAEIGIKVKVTVQDQALWIQDLMALNWQANQIGTSTLTGDADYTLRRLYTTAAKRTPHVSEELDKLLLGQLAETDAAKRQQMFCEVCEYLREQAYVIYLFGTIQTYGLNARVEGFETRPSQFLFFHDVSVK